MKPRDIIITPVLNGFVVNVGCQTVVFNDINTLTENLRDYYKNPSETEMRFLRNKVNDMIERAPLCDDAVRDRVPCEPRPVEECERSLPLPPLNTTRPR